MRIMRETGCTTFIFKTVSLTNHSGDIFDHDKFGTVYISRELRAFGKEWKH